FFFFQAEDGIRDRNVTGVQTCALPILHQVRPAAARSGHVFVTEPVTQPPPARASGGGWWATVREALRGSRHDYTSGPLGRAIVRSEERRVGKGCGCRGGAGRCRGGWRE